MRKAQNASTYKIYVKVKFHDRGKTTTQESQFLFNSVATQFEAAPLSLIPHGYYHNTKVRNITGSSIKRYHRNCELKKRSKQNKSRLGGEVSRFDRCELDFHADEARQFEYFVFYRRLSKQ